MKIINVPIGDIKPYKNNPRKNDDAVPAVAESIKEFGFRVPLLIDKNDVIIAGHTRLKAATKLGMTVIPCIVADDLTPAQVKAYRLMDNKAQEKSRWDEALLQQEFEDLMLLGFDVAKTGFSLEVPEFSFDSEPDGVSAYTHTDYNASGYENTEAGVRYEQDESVGDRGGSSIAEHPHEEHSGYGLNAGVESQHVPEFVCIVCCNGEEEKRTVAKIIGEKGEPKRRYMLSEIVGMLEAHEDD